eukprot:7328177-Prymnesium_polylepis.1
MVTRADFKSGSTQKVAAEKPPRAVKRPFILPDTQEGTVPHRDRPARFPGRWVRHTNSTHASKM